MAHFAELDQDNNVLKVIVVSNEVITDEDGNEQEDLGIEYLKQIYNDPNKIWKQTSYNSNFRSNYAEPGGQYDPENDVFIPVKPYSQWVLNDEYKWIAPTPMPDDINSYGWDEENGDWVLIAMAD